MLLFYSKLVLAARVDAEMKTKPANPASVLKALFYIDYFIFNVL
jgi:hypothetical protein